MSALDNLTCQPGIHIGNRGIDFKRLIESLLKKGNLNQKYIDILTSKESLEIYSSAFTSDHIDENNNYQVYEQLGDLTGNKFIVWYIYDRFPQLNCAEGVKVAARLRINLGSKNSFFSIAEKFGFWDFISAPNSLRLRKKKSLLEDVFEAFLGATESIIDSNTKIGNGYSCVYKILKAIFDDLPISLKYEDLYDAKTRLKELFDIFSDKLGTLRYEEKREELISYTMIYRISLESKKILLGQGSAALKADSEQIASTEALKTLANQGFVKYPPSIYKKFSGNDIPISKTTEKDILKIIESEDNINNLFPTKGKNKYQVNYTSTVLLHYCRKRDFGGIKRSLKMGADPNIRDSDGITSLDALLIGSFNNKTVYRSLNRMIQHPEKIYVHTNVIHGYYQSYMKCETYGKFFKKCLKNFNYIE